MDTRKTSLDHIYQSKTPAHGCEMVNGFLQGELNLHEMLTGGRTHNVRLTTMPTGILRASGVLPGAILVVEHAKQPEIGNMVYVRYNGSQIVRRIIKKNGSWFLISDDPREPVFPVTSESHVERLGVVTWAINKIS